MEISEKDENLQQKIDAYGTLLLRFCFIHLKNVQDAEDVVQDVFYQYIRRSEPFESAEHEKAWLLKVAMNGCRKVWRSAWRKHQSDEEWQDKSEKMIFSGGENENSGPEEYSLEQERRRQLLAAVMALPVKYREVIHLYYYQEFSVKAIAEITGRGESTVTSQLTRGRNMLRKSLKEEYDFE